MHKQSTQDPMRLGFLTALEIPKRGHVAGLLVTNHFGRPLEFQCTTPVKPNRTQELLYGPTLVPFILGDLLSRTLLEKVGVKPQLVLTDSPDMLELRNYVSIPVACLIEDDTTSHSTVVQRSVDSVQTVKLGLHHFAVHPAHQKDLGVLRDRTTGFADTVDLSEPLDRVREALQETMSAGAAA